MINKSTVSLVNKLQYICSTLSVLRLQHQPDAASRGSSWVRLSTLTVADYVFHCNSRHLSGSHPKANGESVYARDL